MLPIDEKNLCWLSRGCFIYIHITLYWVLGIIYSRSFPLYIKIYRVGDNRRTVNTSMSPHISEQLGTETWVEHCYVDLSWVLVCNNIYRYERHFGSLYRYCWVLMFPIAQSLTMLTKAGSQSGKQIIDRTHTWHQCSVTIWQDILPIK